MGVTYKLREEVVHFIISQRQSNPLASCRQVAESTSQKFGLRLSKSSVHDVLKESGIITPRGRKPKNKFEIPQEKKKQIQISLSQVKMLAVQHNNKSDSLPLEGRDREGVVSPGNILSHPHLSSPFKGEESFQVSPEYEGAGRIFIKAALWDLGIFSEENIKATDWNYYLTYAKGIKVVLENNKSFFIDLPLPLERCVRETADGLINNVKPFIVHKVSDQGLFKACMDAQAGFRIENIKIVDEKDHILLEIDNIMEFNRVFMLQNRVFMESREINFMERAKVIFFPQLIDNNEIIENILNLKGFDTISKGKNIVTLLIQNSYENKSMLQEASEKLNKMYLRDEQGRLVSVKIRG